MGFIFKFQFNFLKKIRLRCVDKFNLNYKYKKQTKLYDGSELIFKFINKVIVCFFVGYLKVKEDINSSF